MPEYAIIESKNSRYITSWNAVVGYRNIYKIDTTTFHDGFGYDKAPLACKIRTSFEVANSLSALGRTKLSMVDVYHSRRNTHFTNGRYIDDVAMQQLRIRFQAQLEVNTSS